MAKKELEKSEDLYTSSEAAEFLGVSPRTIQLWSDSGILKAQKTLGGHRRFTASTLLALANELINTDKDEQAEGEVLRVLVAEDEPDLRKLYEITFSEWNYPLDVHLVKDGYEALLQFGRINPHVLILDLHMPRMDGFHMLNVIHETIGSTDTEIIVVTALSQKNISEHGVLKKGVRILNKPIPFDVIEDLIRKRVKRLNISLV